MSFIPSTELARSMRRWKERRDRRGRALELVIAAAAAILFVYALWR